MMKVHFALVIIYDFYKQGNIRILMRTVFFR